MTKLLIVFLFTTAISCGQNRSVNRAGDSVGNTKLSFDTNKVAILAIDTHQQWLFKDASSMDLTSRELKDIDVILRECIRFYNIQQDTTKEFSDFIDWRRYKVQYIPFISENGHRKVYVNAFCDHYWNFDSTGWKKYLIQVDDGGSCFFQLTINLTEMEYEQFYTNGHG